MTKSEMLRILEPHIECAQHKSLGSGRDYHFVHDKWHLDGVARFYFQKGHERTKFYNSTGRVWMPNQTPELNEAIALYEALILGPKYYELNPSA